ncbi:Uncharacterized protein TCM_014142 [Theobroma cacao]|uniref:Uncharacterized protein n=1 Tax=Theobroma cacao TaxID=3641 RepID=A0A061FWP2_THECC|nr:Uncharacterized protein TCM_014142 [Theobroma cacao]
MRLSLLKSVGDAFNFCSDVNVHNIIFAPKFQAETIKLVNGLISQVAFLRLLKHFMSVSFCKRMAVVSISYSAILMKDVQCHWFQ